LSDDNLEKGWRSFEDSEFDKAKSIAERELRDNPEDPESMLLLAASHRGLGDFEQALEVLEAATDIAVDWSAPELWMAEILAQDLDRPVEALDHAAQALERAEDSVLQYETAVKNDKLLLVAHGTANEVQRARDILHQTGAEITTVHAEPAVVGV